MQIPDAQTIAAYLSTFVVSLTVVLTAINVRGGLLGNAKVRLEIAEKLSAAIAAKNRYLMEEFFHQLYRYRLSADIISHIMSRPDPTASIENMRHIHERIEFNAKSHIFAYKGVWKNKHYRRASLIFGHAVYWPCAFLALMPMMAIPDLLRQSPSTIAIIPGMLIVFGFIAYQGVKVIWIHNAFQKLDVGS